MDPIKMLKIGTLVEMEVINNVYDGELFLTKISDIDESHETLDLNLPMENRQYVIARNGEQVKVSVKKEMTQSLEMVMLIVYMETRVMTLSKVLVLQVI